MHHAIRARDDERRSPVHKVRQMGRRFWREWRATILFVLLVVVPVKSSIADWNWVPTGSMNPTILEGDLIFVNKLAYDLRVPLTMHRLARWGRPQRGDIVICLSPDDGTRLVKRIVGVPGDVVEMRDNILYLNGRPVPYSRTREDYCSKLRDGLAEESICEMEELDEATHPVLRVPGMRAMRSFGPLTVPPGRYFVLGDNRDQSRDSRFFGFVPRKSILGKARAVLFSFDITELYLPRLTRFFSPLR